LAKEFLVEAAKVKELEAKIKDQVAIGILAGGRSKRFGFDKFLLKFSGKNIIETIIDRISDLSEYIYLNFRDSAQFKLFKKHVDLNFIEKQYGIKIGIVYDLNFKDFKEILNQEELAFIDQSKLGGPLLGIASILSKSQKDLVLFLPCDAPLVNKADLIKIFKYFFKYNPDILYGRWSNGFIEPLFSIWRRSKVFKQVCQLLLSGKRRIRSALSKDLDYKVKTFDIETLLGLKFQSINLFYNINSREDLNRIFNKRDFNNELG